MRDVEIDEPCPKCQKKLHSGCLGKYCPACGWREDSAEVEVKPLRRKLPPERESITHKFSISGHEGYLTIGMHPDGTPGEMFITMAKEGSTISGLMDSFATMTSLALQYGVPLQVMVDKFTHTRFEPSGFTKNPDIPMTKSIMDYIFKWMAKKFLPKVEPTSSPLPSAEASKDSSAGAETRTVTEMAPSCSDCGSVMVRNGVCYKCLNCGNTSGCS